MFEKILVALDGSNQSLEALKMGAMIADQNKSKLTILSAVEPLPPIATPVNPTAPPKYITSYTEDQRESYKDIHEKQIDKFSDMYSKLSIESKIIEGRAFEVIIDESKRTDLIVMGHQGQGNVLDWMLGSVAKKVLDRSKKPVLIAKKETE